MSDTAYQQIPVKLVMSYLILPKRPSYAKVIAIAFISNRIFNRNLAKCNDKSRKCKLHNTKYNGVQNVNYNRKLVTVMK